MVGPSSSDKAISHTDRFFVGRYCGVAVTEADAVVSAQLPNGSVLQTQFETVGGGRLLTFKAPPQSTDTKGLEVLIIEPTSSGNFLVWQSATDLATHTREQADEDVKNYREIVDDTFRVFERK